MVFSSTALNYIFKDETGNLDSKSEFMNVVFLILRPFLLVFILDPLIYLWKSRVRKKEMEKPFSSFDNVMESAFAYWIIISGFHLFIFLLVKFL